MATFWITVRSIPENVDIEPFDWHFYIDAADEAAAKELAEYTVLDLFTDTVVKVEQKKREKWSEQ